MSTETDHPAQPCLSTTFQIRIKGQLGSQWTSWFEGLVIKPEENGETILIGPVVDQAALYGLLKKVRDLGMTLLAVNCLDQEQSDAVSPCAPGPNNEEV